MGIIPKIVRDFFIESPERKEQRETQAAKIQKETHEKHVRWGAESLKNNGITCRCNGLAVPTSEKGRIYRCIRCNKQFANALYILNLYCPYDEAVNLLIKEDK